MKIKPSDQKKTDNGNIGSKAAGSFSGVNYKVEKMKWYNCNSPISYESSWLIEAIDFFVLHCPASNRSYVKDGALPDGKKKKKMIYKDVSARDCSFHRNGITGNLLSTILAEIRRPIAKQGLYQIIETDADVEMTAETLLHNRTGSDQCPDLIVIHKRSDMPDSESIYYYIRNAFAHGSFEIVRDDKNQPVYRFESKKNETIKARMQLKEKTLIHLKELAEMSPREIKQLQRQKNKS